MHDNSPEKHNIPAAYSYTKLGIIVADMGLFLLLLATLPFDRPIAVGLSILICVAVLWITEAVHVSVTALLVPLLAVGFGVFSTSQALSYFAHPIIFLFLGGFALAAALQHQQLDKIIAEKIFLIARGKLSIAVFMLFGVTFFLSMWISNIATTAMMLPLVLGILSPIDAKKERGTYVFVLLGVAYCASIGGMATLVGSPPNAVAAAEVGLDFMQWLAWGLPVALVLFPIVIGILYVVFKPNLQHRFTFQPASIPWTGSTSLTLVIFAMTAGLWILGKPINALLGGIGGFDTLVALLAIVLIGVFRLVPWKSLERSTSWGVLILFGGGICLSHLLKDTGTSAFLAHALAQQLQDANLLMVLMMIVSFVIVLTELMSNTATAVLLIPLFSAMSATLPISPQLTSVLIALAASCAFMLPVATPPNAVVFGTGHIRQTEMMRVGIFINIAAIGVLTLIAWLFW